MGERRCEDPAAFVCCTRYRPRKTDATSDASQTFAYVRVGDMDDHRGAPERARATCSYLVARRTGLQASKSAWLLAKIPLAPVDSCVEGHVNEQ